MNEAPSPDRPRVFVHGLGAVSPAGWGVGPLRDALAAVAPLPVRPIPCPDGRPELMVRRVPPATMRPAFLNQPRLRRSSAVSQFLVSAALEALGPDAGRVRAGEFRLGIICAVMTGGVNYSRRFYDETLQNPATASPLLFPETVFNAPASHLGALLGSSARNYTLVGDQSAFVQGLAIAAEWLALGEVDGCVVAAAEEADWLTAAARRLFDRDAVVAEGAGAVYLRREPAAIELTAITSPSPYTRNRSRLDAVAAMRRQLPSGEKCDLMIDSTAGLPGDAAEEAAWMDWPGRRCAPKRVLGDGLAAAGAWACVSAAATIDGGTSARGLVSVVGVNQQAVGVGFAAAG